MFGTDSRLVKRLRSRDRDAAEEMVDRYHARIYRYLLLLCRDPERAADLVQETFCSVWSSIDSFRSRSSLSTWIHSIARNHFLQQLRRERSAGVSPPPDLTAIPDRPEAGPEEQMRRLELERRLQREIERLSPDRREIIQLHYLQELSLRESSGVLGVPVGTVKSRLNAALRDLRRMFSQGERCHERPDRQEA
jgi:RNA polymerase sigma-70 factor (ECF subfamily)